MHNTLSHVPIIFKNIVEIISFSFGTTHESLRSTSIGISLIRGEGKLTKKLLLFNHLNIMLEVLECNWKVHDGETWKEYHGANKVHLETQNGNMETLWKKIQEIEMTVG